LKNPIQYLNKLFESRVRLGIMSALMVDEWVDFNDFKELLEVTDGNLASHLKALESSEYIELRKQFAGRKPRTSYRASEKGKTAFQSHLTALEKMINNG